MTTRTRGKPAPRPRTAPKLDISKTVRDFRSKHLVPGISVAVSYRGEIIQSRTYGYREGPPPGRIRPHDTEWTHADDQTHFRLASVSKAVTSVIAMRLAARGKLDLDGSIHDYIDDFPVTKGTLTPRMLLSHTSGIKHYGGRKDTGRYNKQAWGDCTDVAPLLFDTADRFNRRYLYSTHAYTILGACLEGASGMDFARLLHEELKPAGRNLISCEGRPVGGKPAKVSWLWAHRAGKRKNAKRVHYKYKLTPRDRLNWKWPGGGMLSTARKLATFGNAVADGTLLSDRWQDEMWTAQRLWNGDIANGGYGLGWNFGTWKNQRVVAHNGVQRGASAYLRILPDREIAVSIMTNTRDLPVVTLGRELMASVYDHTRPKPRKTTSTRPGKRPTPKRL